MLNIIKAHSVNLEEHIVISEKKEKEDDLLQDEPVEITEDEAISAESEFRLQSTQMQCEEMVNQAMEQSREIINKANADAEEILGKALEEGANIRKESDETGFKQGYERGYSESLIKYRALIEEAKNIVTDAERYKVDTVNSMEGEIIELVTACVEKITKKVLSENDEILLNLVKIAIDSLAHRDYISIKVNREDHAYIEMVKERILAQFPGIHSIDIRVDDTMKKGDLEVESESGTVNPSISKQIKKLVSEFDKLFANEELV